MDVDERYRFVSGLDAGEDLGGNNTNIQGMLNVPLLDGTLAVRAVGYQFRNSGFYENQAASDPARSALASEYGVPGLARNRRNVGNDEYVGGRLSVLWAPSDDLRATLTYLNQKLDQDGFPEADLSTGGRWSQTRLQMPPLRFGRVSSAGGADHLGDDLETTNLVIEYDLGWASLVSSTSWVHEFAVRNLDATDLFEVPAVHLQGNQADASSRSCACHPSSTAWCSSSPVCSMKTSTASAISPINTGVTRRSIPSRT